MTLYFDKDYYARMRAERREHASKLASDLAEDFLKSVTDETEEGITLDYDALVEKLASSKLFETDSKQKLLISDLVAKVEEMQPEIPALNPGAYVVIGRTAKGKTTWLKELLSQFERDDTSFFISHDEPKLLTDAYGTSRGLDELLPSFTDVSKMRSVNVIALDGIRTIQYESTGNTLNGGVNSGFFRFLTDIGNAAVDAGVVLLMTYNPNTEKDETYKLVSMMVDGAVQGIINLDESTIKSRYHRRFENPLSQSFNLLFTQQGSTIEEGLDATLTQDTTEV